jgi:hypothetical protein
MRGIGIAAVGFQKDLWHGIFLTMHICLVDDGGVLGDWDLVVWSLHDAFMHTIP